MTYLFIFFVLFCKNNISAKEVDLYLLYLNQAFVLMWDGRTILFSAGELFQNHLWVINHLYHLVCIRPNPALDSCVPGLLLNFGSLVFLIWCPFYTIQMTVTSQNISTSGCTGPHLRLHLPIYFVSRAFLAVGTFYFPGWTLESFELVGKFGRMSSRFVLFVFCQLKSAMVKNVWGFQLLLLVLGVWR